MIYGCIAQTLKHSFSKIIHEQLFDYSYELKEIAPEDLESFMIKREFKAINVTIPYKEAVIPYLSEISDEARRIGAVNTIVNVDGKLKGYNTDYAGLKDLLRRNSINAEGKKVLILGSGGTSKTAHALMQDLGSRQILRVSRRRQDGCITYDDAVNEHLDAQIIINATPCGMYPKNGESPLDLSVFTKLEGVVDAIYNPLRSRLVCDALERGISATGGLYMLVAQGAYAAEIFTGQKVSVEKIESVYKKILADKENIVLIGMPGSGKSSIGRRLAKEYGMDFIDIDEEIVKSEKMEIPSIFAQKGENAFRDIEEKIIHRIASNQHTVISTGGGAVLRSENLKILRENGRIYFLDRPLEELATTEDRPLSSNREALERRYKERYSIYRDSCQKHIDASGQVEDVVNRIKKDVAHEYFGD